MMLSSASVVNPARIGFGVKNGFGWLDVDRGAAESLLGHVLLRPACRDETLATAESRVRAIHVVQEILLLTTLAQATLSEELFEGVLESRVLSGGDCQLAKIGLEAVEIVAEQPLLFATNVSVEQISSRYELICAALRV